MYLNINVSYDAPKHPKGSLWLKPVKDGFVLYWLNEGIWKPLKVVDEKNTASIIDDEPIDGSKIKIDDSSTSGTLLGAI